jgi:hypothetical protein
MVDVTVLVQLSRIFMQIWVVYIIRALFHVLVCLLLLLHHMPCLFTQYYDTVVLSILLKILFSCGFLFLHPKIYSDLLCFYFIKLEIRVCNLHMRLRITEKYSVLSSKIIGYTITNVYTIQIHLQVCKRLL